MNLFNLPNELLLEIAKSLDPVDIKNFLELRPDFAHLLIPILEKAVQRTFYCPTVCWAAENGHGNLIRLLIDNQVNLEVKDEDRSTALHYAAGGAVNTEANNISVMKLLLDNVPCPGDYINGDVFDDYGYTIFHRAVEDSRDDTIRFLLEIGVDVNQINHKNGQAALHIAAQSPEASTIGILLENGANIDTRDYNEQTPLLYALRFGSNPMLMVQELLQRGANSLALDDFGRTALHILLEATGRPSDGLEWVYRITKLLLRAGITINAQDIYGRTILHTALEGLHEQRVIDLLLGCGADMSIPDGFGTTALQFMVNLGYATIAPAVI